MFRHLIKLSTFYSSQLKYSDFISPHILQIIQTNPSYSPCVQDFHLFLEEQTHLTPNQIRAYLNLIYNVHSLPDLFSSHKCQLIKMIKTQKIKNQSQLDRITKWLGKKMKVDRNVKIEDCQKFSNCEESEINELDAEIKIIARKGQNIDIAELSKCMRLKYQTIDSQVIYNKCKEVKVMIESKTSTICENLKKQKKSNQFWDKLQNIRPRILEDECNDVETTQKHLEITNNQLRFRFPPEPNGYLHIGHIKSIRINFETAKRMGGSCYLRYDDTNPETESHQYIDNILKNIRWLGYEPDKITFASDYFPEMLQFAIELIKKGHAYVCDSPQEQIQQQRKQKRENIFRKRSIQQSLQHFPNLSQGQTLRLKLNPEAANPTLRDPVIYRRKNKPHPRTGTKYSIYPIYDYAHCIGDSLEHIDYSLCSLEFQVRRQLYYKILHLLNLYKPCVWEYSRLNVEGSVISKRKIKDLLDKEVIEGWSDARLLTIGGLINRGYTPSMLFKFIDKVNASRTGNQNIVQFSLLEKEMRKQLLEKSQKSMMVLSPLNLHIQNMKESVTVENGLIVNKNVYIQSTDDLQADSIIILKYFGPLIIKQVQESGLVGELIPQTIEELKKQKRKYKVLHWISEDNCCKIDVVLFNRLLDAKGNPTLNSKIQVKNALVNRKVMSSKNQVQRYWQMERLGFFKFNQQQQLIRCVSFQ